MKKVAIDYAGEIYVGPGNAPLSLFPHQQSAITALNSMMLHRRRSPFEGLLVVPTGGGKTLIVVRWLLRNMIDQHKKVLWIAHRHELLEQAFLTVKTNAYSDILSNKPSFRFRIISGQHDRPVNIQREDDIIIASKDSLNRGLGYLLDNWLRFTDEVLLVIDEAHHSPAKTYRKIINAVKSSNGDKRRFQMLGVTATPFRTAQSEQGLIGELFPDDIVFGIDLRTLIAQGILSEPVFEELRTDLDLARELTTSDIKAIQAFDRLPQRIAQQIAESRDRNKRIVTHYVQNQEKYRQLLVFAVNVNHAIVLNEVFNVELNRHFKTKGKTYSEYVVGDVIDAATGVRIASEENKEKIRRFRDGEVQVLVNVNILTEGTDLPNVQTVFLARPTMSTVLMTQMIGRALRGEKAGGTKEAYIVSFIDDWKDKISWVNPESVRIETSGVFPAGTEATKQLVRLISIGKIEEFARMMNERVPELEALKFSQRIPVGIYSFSVLFPSSDTGDALEKNCEVLVFDHIQQAFRDFVNDLDVLFEDVELIEDEILSNKDLDRLFKIVIAEYFEGYDLLPGYRDEDIKDILRYFAQKGIVPSFLRFEEREKCDLAQVAQYVYDTSLGGKAEVDYVDSRWDDENSFWRVLFGHRKEYFVRQLSIEVEKVAHPELFQREAEKPTVRIDKVDISHLSLSEMRKKDSVYWRTLRNRVFADYTDENDCITCAISGFKSMHRIHFQIDHNVPISKGGLSTIDNLQIVARWENVKKGDELEAHCMRCRTSRPMLSPRRITLPNGRPALKDTCPECGAILSRIISTKT